MKSIKITIVGLMTWLITLIWPEVNQWLSPVGMLGAVIGLGSLIIGYFAHQQRRRGMLVPQQSLAPVRTADSHPLKPVRVI